MRAITAAVLAVTVGAGCSSSYMPQSRGRIAMIMQGGMQTYVRDGRLYPHGMLGGGLEDAVRGVPAAEQAASEYRGRLKTGLLVGVGGLVCSSVAFGLALAETAPYDYDDGNNDDVPTAAWVALGCLAVSLGGLGYMITAEPYRWDAINLFNDSVAPAPVYPLPALPGTAPAGGPPGRYLLRPNLSLRMRDE